MKKHILHVLVFLALAGPVLAQEAPVPRNSPRVPVNRESLADHKPAIPPSREIQGQAIIVDGERLRINDLDLRLFGVVPPQLSASFGPQARTVLDELTAGQNVTCLIRDRDREGRFLATCRNANNTDLALELLRRGLAVTARGSISSTDLAAAYIAAEQAAQTQKAGLWSFTVPAPVVVPDAAKISMATSTNASAAAVEQSHPKPIEIPAAPAVAKPDQTPPKPIEIVSAKPKPVTAQVADDLVTADKAANSEALATPQETSVLVRYQLLITGLVMLATALGMLGAISIQRIIDRRTEIRAIAAALRGELMAARAVCLGRLKTTNDAEDKDISWPRIRSTLYQAYVGRLGWLGAELARRVASIYGQASDYAAYYDGNDDTRASSMPKRQALQTLAQHIEEILPRLAIIEHTGSRSGTGTGLSKLTASGESVAERPPISAHNPQQKVAAAKASAAQAWAGMQALARRWWGESNPSKSQDPIAEYTALIEEEMKRFAFDESEDESASLPANITKLHGTGT